MIADPLQVAQCFGENHIRLRVVHAGFQALDVQLADLPVEFIEVAFQAAGLLCQLANCEICLTNGNRITLAAMLKMVCALAI